MNATTAAMLNGFGPAFGYLGYQVHTRNFFRALNRHLPVCLCSNNSNVTGMTVPADMAQMLARQSVIDLSLPAVCIGYGNDFHKFHGARRIGFTMFEYTRLAADWINGIRQLDALWTTSVWGRDIVRANGLTDVPVEIVPAGFDPAIFHPGLRGTKGKGAGKPFRFLTVGKWEVRKGQTELLRAWAKAFRGIKDVELLMLCDNPFVRGFSAEEEIRKLGLGAMPPVRVLKPLPTDVEMAEQYAQADCFVMPTRAEGWGLPIMEAMACGTPVITTRYSAITEYANAQNAYLLEPVAMVPVHDPWFFPRAGESGVWAEISVDELAERMLHVYRHRDEAAALGAHSAQDMLAHWTWDHGAQKAEAILQRDARTTGQTFPAPLSADAALAAARAGMRSSEVLNALNVTQLIGLADELGRTAPAAEVVGLYRAWLAVTDSTLAFVAHFNLGRLLSDAGDLEAAAQHYEAALRQKPDFAQAMLNLGSVRERQKRFDEAIALWQDAVEKVTFGGTAPPELLTHGLNSLGRLLEQQHRYPESAQYLVRSLAVDPTQEDVIHHWVHLRQKQCEWPVFTTLPGLPAEQARRCASALAMLSASNDPAEQLAIAQAYARAKIPADLPALAPPGGYAHERLRIGYLSSNLNWHAVTILSAEVYELHDRQRVEVWGFCWSPEDGTPMRGRVRAAMDHLIRIDQMSDVQAAQAIRAAEIDVLIDLQGLTNGCRPHILAHRPAPVQVSWLGFPGTSGIPGVDYIIADHYLIPEPEVPYYSEQPLYLAPCFQPNDRQRAASPVGRRAEHALPEQALVFCAFNHNHKFTPELFAHWMAILRRVPDSVLWLLADNATAQHNLCAAAQAAGVDATRLVFAPRALPGDYLARFALADLFLDTFPFNGGTTVSDALWMGLPVLTCSGRTFAARMAGSLLHAVGLPELITSGFAEYEERAVALASDRKQLTALRQRLQAQRDTCPLFDTPRFVRMLEDTLLGIARQPGGTHH